MSPRTARIFDAAGGIGFGDGRFFVVGGLPEGVKATGPPPAP